MPRGANAVNGSHGDPSEPLVVTDRVPENEEIAPTPTDGGYKVYPMRWVALLQLCLLNGGNSAQWIVFGIVFDQAKEDFGLSTEGVNLLSAEYEIVFAILAPLAIIIYQHMGLRAGLRWASVFNSIGCLLRFVAVLVAPNYACLLVSQGFLAVTIVFVFSAPPILAARWFGESERTLATTIGAMSNSLGLALGQLIPPLIVTPDNHSRGRWGLLFALMCSYSLFEAALVFFVIPEGPPTAPSCAEEVKCAGRAATAESMPRVAHHHHGGDSDSSDSNSSFGGDTRRSTVVSEVREHLGAAQQILRMLHVKAFAGVFAASGLYFGAQWSVISLLPQLLKPFGVSEKTVGWVGFGQIILGIVAAVRFSGWIDKIRRYQAPLAGLLIAATVLYFAFAVVFLADFNGAVYVGSAIYILLGVPQACAIPVVFEYAVELTYPLSESNSGMAVMWLANAATIPMMFGLPALVGSDPTKGGSLLALFALAIFSAVAAVLIVLPNGVLKRQQYEVACREAAATGNHTSDNRVD